MVLLATLSFSLLLISVFAHQHARFPGDLALELRLQAFQSSFTTQAMKAISELGGGQVGTAVLVAAVLLFLIRHRRGDSLLLIAVGLLSLVNRILKVVVDRPRPSPDLVSVLQINNSSSFPSGHATFAVAFFGALFYLSTIYISVPSLRKAAQIGAVALILATGMSRVYLGAHWPSDVLGGYLLGCLILIPLVWLHRRARGAID